MGKTYSWDYRFEISPYEKIIDLLEAFFSSFPGGEYQCEKRERYRLMFRRGQWRKSLLGLGEFVPDALVKGRFDRWPVIVVVLVRPSPNHFSVAVRYELHLPKSIASLAEPVQTSVDQHARAELDQLAAYLAECIGLDTPPTINVAPQP